MPKFHIQNVNERGASSNNDVVFYASFANVIRYALPRRPPGAYMIHRLHDFDLYAPPIESRPAYVRARRQSQELTA